MWLLAGLIALACLLIFNTFLFGNDTLVYSDTGDGHERAVHHDL